MAVTIYHNPRCSKSRQTLALLQEKGVEPHIVEYLQAPPDAATLHSILVKLGMSPRDLIRTSEEDYKKAQDQLVDFSDAALIDWMTANPRVIQRPIVVTEKAARIGRPPESVLEILD